MPFLSLQDPEIKRLAKIPQRVALDEPNVVVNILTKAGNSMGTARRCNLARLIRTLRHHQLNWPWSPIMSQPEGIQILTRVSESVLLH